MKPTLDFAPADYIPPNGCGPALSLLVGVGLLGIALGAVIVLMLVRARSLAIAQAHDHAEMVERAARPLSRGPRRVVQGRVELDGSDDVAVEIDIEQIVVDHSAKNGRWHTWSERSRETRASPFYLVRADGGVVYVEPGDDLLVVDALGTSYPDDKPRVRVRSADVRRGETFFVYGDLDQGMHPRARRAYRDGSGWILRAPRRGTMLLATEGIRDRYRARISYLRSAGLLMGLAFCVLHATTTVPFLAATLLGTQTTAEVVHDSTWVTHSRSGTTRHYGLTARTSDGFTLEDEVPRAVYDAARATRSRDEVPVIPMLRTRDWTGASYFGVEPYTPARWLFLAGVAFPIVLMLVASAYRRKLAWYDQPKLVEHGGTGHWVETRPRSPIDPTVN